MLYHWYELGHAAAWPGRAAAEVWLQFFNPLNPLTHTPLGRSTAAGCELYERATRRYTKPKFGIHEIKAAAGTLKVREETVWTSPFCRLVHFKRDIAPALAQQQPRLLLVAPMSGHFATLLRGTVETFLRDHEVYITDWQDARHVPVSAGRFDLDDYIDTMSAIFRYFKGNVHVFAVCQPSVPVLAATALMEADADPAVPRSLTLAGGPIDTRINPTAVNALAERKGSEWFERNVITTVPWPLGGCGRAVYPGFLQLSGFMMMNLDRHMRAHREMFHHLVRGDGDFSRKAPEILRRVHGRDGSHGRILPADDRQRVRPTSSAAWPHDVARPARRPRRHPASSAHDRRRRKRRHHRHGPMQRSAGSLQRYSGGPESPL